MNLADTWNIDLEISEQERMHDHQDKQHHERAAPRHLILLMKANDTFAKLECDDLSLKGLVPYSIPPMINETYGKPHHL